MSAKYIVLDRMVQGFSQALARTTEMNREHSQRAQYIHLIPQVIANALEDLLVYIAQQNLGPTKSSRYLYLWFFTISSAWSWVRTSSDVRIQGQHDGWNWSQHYPINDMYVYDWFVYAVNTIMPFFVPGSAKDYDVLHKAEYDIETVKREGNWTTWYSRWQQWFTDRQQNDGAIQAAAVPSDSELPNTTSTLVVADSSIDPNTFAQPKKWTPLNVQNKRQKYLTYNWGTVRSSCLTAAAESQIEQIATTFFPTTDQERNTEIQNIVSITQTLTDEQKMIAEFWAGGPGTVSPPCMFAWIWKETVLATSPSATKTIYSGLDLAIHLFEGARVTWALKKLYMQARPIQDIRRLYRGQTLTSWNGSQIQGEAWTPYQETNFVSPPFADFPSGHSHFSQAFALSMNKWFGPSVPQTQPKKCTDLTLLSPIFQTSPSSIPATPLGTFVIPAQSSQIQLSVVPSAPVTLSFSTWQSMADSAGVSRFYGGIHCISAHTSSQEVARQVDTAIQSGWNIVAV